MIPVAPGSELRQVYAHESQEIRRRFLASSDGRDCIEARAALLDKVVSELFAANVAKAAQARTAMVAIGGYGRKTLFPHSDVDLLFLCADENEEAEQKPNLATVTRELWDMRVRVSPVTRTLTECSKPQADNLEFTIALLDARLVCGSAALFEELQSGAIPRILLRERAALVRDLVALTRQRHKKFSDTVFHLEPNVKDGPGGLRDLNVVHWLRSISRHALHAREVQEQGGEDVSPNAFEFLAATRCFLHYRNGRDDNQLSYERQAEAADESIGVRQKVVLRSADWMRMYFRNAREIDRRLAQLIDEVPVGNSSLYSRFEQWRSRLSTAEYSVVNGRVFVKYPATMEENGALLGLFELIARHDLKLSADAERQVRRAVMNGHADVVGAGAWRGFRQILIQPAAARALRAMHELGVLRGVLPEFEAIDSLVIGDYYHRYTVDEHSFTAIDLLHRLRTSKLASDQRFLEILEELEQPELLFLSLLLHDVGKASAGEQHVYGSVAACERACERLQIEAVERETLRFLIANHLEMSATLMRRDISDPTTIKIFAEKVATPERLKMLTLMTYADIGAVSPETLTPWKAEWLWQLYAAAMNHMLRSVDAERIDRPEEREFLQAAKAVPGLDEERLTGFVHGMPRRYLLMHSAEQVGEHCRLAQRLGDTAAQVTLRETTRGYELTVITRDRPRLFVALTGLLAAWGMNILKADAFANASETVVDTFQFADVFGTLAQNESEGERLGRELLELLSCEISDNTLRCLDARVKKKSSVPAKVQVPTRIWFDEASSAHSTIVEIVARDRPGLLYDIGSALAGSGCNIEIALIDTEGQKAIDVLYITRESRKLSKQEQNELRALLLSKL